jgi:hypothetical protein
MRSVVMVVVMMTLIGVASAQEGRSEAMAPFDEVRWLADPSSADDPGSVGVSVRIGETWYSLESVNGSTLPDLLRGIAKVYPKRDVAKRFEEDLVEVLEKIGVDRGETARLGVRSEGDDTVKVINAEWSADKRRGLRDRRDERRRHSEDGAIAAGDVEAAFRALEVLIETRSSYAAGLQGTDWRARLAEAKARAGEIKTRSGLTERLTRVVAGIGDGHASVSGPESPRAGWLPFLPVPLAADGPVLAVLPGRTGFVDPEAPVLKTIDGVAIERWLEAAAATVPRGSLSLIRDRSCRALRDLETLRAIVDPAAAGSREVRLELSSADGTRSTTRLMPLATRTPTFGEWPRHESGLRRHAGVERPVGYVRLATMDGESAEKLSGDLAAFARAGVIGLVVDVRGNGGGSREALRVLAGAILAKDSPPVVINAARPLLVDGRVPPEVAESMRRRGLREDTSEEWTEAERRAITRFKIGFAPKPHVPDDRFGTWWYACVGPDASADAPRWVGRVVILQDAGCFSATDVFLAAMKQLPRVTLVGEASGGGSGAAIEHRLVGGLTVRLSTMVSYQPTGELFDGVGVVPHVILTREPIDAINGTDRWLERALTIAGENP